MAPIWTCWCVRSRAQWLIGVALDEASARQLCRTSAAELMDLYGQRALEQARWAAVAVQPGQVLDDDALADQVDAAAVPLRAWDLKGDPA